MCEQPAASHFVDGKNVNNPAGPAIECIHPAIDEIIADYLNPSQVKIPPSQDAKHALGNTDWSFISNVINRTYGQPTVRRISK